MIIRVIYNCVMIHIKEVLAKAITFRPGPLCETASTDEEPEVQTNGGPASHTAHKW